MRLLTIPSTKLHEIWCSFRGSVFIGKEHEQDSQECCLRYYELFCGDCFSNRTGAAVDQSERDRICALLDSPKKRSRRPLQSRLQQSAPGFSGDCPPLSESPGRPATVGRGRLDQSALRIAPLADFALQLTVVLWVG